MQKRGQAAMEFLMTYGWALIIIVIAIAALFFLGVFTTSSTSACTLGAPLSCEGALVLDNAVLLQVRGPSEGLSKVESVSINGEACPTLAGEEIENSKINIVRCTGLSLEKGEQVAVEIKAFHRPPGGFPTDIEGSATGDAAEGNHIYDIDQDLVAAWDFERNVVDITGNGHDGIKEGGVDCSVEGKVGNGCYFDGVDDAIKVLDHDDIDFDFDQSFSVEFWVRVDSDAPSGIAIIEKWHGGRISYPYTFRYTNTDHPDKTGTDQMEFIRYRVNPNDTSQRASVSVKVPTALDEWHHMVGVKDAPNNAMLFYQDGVLINSAGDNLGGPTTSDHDLFFGRRGNDASPWYAYMILDQVAIYRRALTAEEVLEHYQQSK